MWFCEVPESPESDHLSIRNTDGNRRREYLLALAGGAHEFDAGVAESLRDAATTFFVVSSHYESAGEDEPARVETHRHVPEHTIETLNEVEISDEGVREFFGDPENYEEQYGENVDAADGRSDHGHGAWESRRAPTPEGT